MKNDPNESALCREVSSLFEKIRSLAQLAENDCLQTIKNPSDVNLENLLELCDLCMNLYIDVVNSLDSDSLFLKTHRKKIDEFRGDFLIAMKQILAEHSRKEEK